ncbi:unnamed protein product [Linum tenue]|uniref:Uncharacterized protein n=1 Tax=Linum tenue TaxID=586396 RepID=A0AAV0I770_9ROSI|nr:unnamed protein product [Linum tenue]
MICGLNQCQRSGDLSLDRLGFIVTLSLQRGLAQRFSNSSLQMLGPTCCLLTLMRKLASGTQ